MKEDIPFYFLHSLPYLIYFVYFRAGFFRWPTEKVPCEIFVFAHLGAIELVVYNNNTNNNDIFMSAK